LRTDGGALCCGDKSNILGTAMTALRLLAIVGAVSVLVGLVMASFPVLILHHHIGDMNGAGFHPSQFAMATHLSGIIIIGVGAALLVIAAIINRFSN
jgi:hypothetical protein